MGGPADSEALAAFAEKRDPDFTNLPPGCDRERARLAPTHRRRRRGVADLMVAIEQADGFGEHYPPTTSPTSSARRASTSARHGHGPRGRGDDRLRDHHGPELASSGGFTIGLWGGVRPSHHGRGIGRDLLSRMEAGPRTSTGTGSRAPRAGSSSTRSTTPPTGATCSSGPATRSSAGSSTWSATSPSRWRHPACPRT